MILQRRTNKPVVNGITKKGRRERRRQDKWERMVVMIRDDSTLTGVPLEDMDGVGGDGRGRRRGGGDW